MEDIGSLYKMFDDLMEIQKENVIYSRTIWKMIRFFDHNSKEFIVP